MAIAGYGYKRVSKDFTGWIFKIFSLYIKVNNIYTKLVPQSQLGVWSRKEQHTENPWLYKEPQGPTSVECTVMLQNT